jgi:hypothetical protein
VFCREHAMQLHRDREEFEAAGVELVAIGQGNVKQAAHFRESQGVDELRLLVDRKREAYRRAGTKVATVGELVGPAGEYLDGEPVRRLRGGVYQLLRDGPGREQLGPPSRRVAGHAKSLAHLRHLELAVPDATYGQRRRHFG